MKKVALLTGGQSSERLIAQASAQTVQNALEKNFEVTVFDFPEQIDLFVQLRNTFCAAVPIFHGKGGEDGQIQGFLKTLQVPFIFSDLEAHAVAMNKILTKQVVQSVGLKTPDWQRVFQKEDINLIPPFVVKPISDGSSFGVAIYQTMQQVIIDQESLVENFVTGREFTVAVIDEVGALPVIEIRSKNSFFDYESKYDASLVEELCPASIDEVLTKRLQDFAMDVHKLIGARHISRSDFIVDEDGEVWFLEINTIPGLTETSLVPKALRVIGLSLETLLKKWIEEVE